MRYQYKTRGTCARAIAFDYENYRTVHQMNYHNLYDDEGKLVYELKSL